MSIYYRANLKRWSELVAKKKLENQQNENEATKETKEEKQETSEKMMDTETKSKDNNDGVNEVPAASDGVKKTLVEKVKSQALTDVSFSSDEE